MSPLGTLPPVGGPPDPLGKFGSVTPCCFKQFVYAVREAVPDDLALVELVLDPAAGELPQAARMTGTQLTKSAVRAALRRLDECRDRELADGYASGAARRE